MSLLDECDVYAGKHDILFNPVKANRILPHHLLTMFLVKCYHFMNMHIKYVTTCIFMGFSITNSDIGLYNECILEI